MWLFIFEDYHDRVYLERQDPAGTHVAWQGRKWKCLGLNTHVNVASYFLDAPDVGAPDAPNSVPKAA